MSTGRYKLRMTTVCTIWGKGVVILKDECKILWQILQKYMIISNTDRAFLRRSGQKMSCLQSITPGYLSPIHIKLAPCLFSVCVLCVPSRFSHVQLFVVLWILAPQAPLYMGLSRQEYWSGLSWSHPLSV